VVERIVGHRSADEVVRLLGPLAVPGASSAHAQGLAQNEPGG
jgi:hypothetical protein